MTIIHVDDVLRVLRSEPNGLTTRQVAERLHLSRLDAVSIRLSKLADYGKIDREYVTGDQRQNQASHWCLWKAKQPSPSR